MEGLTSSSDHLNMALTSLGLSIIFLVFLIIAIRKNIKERNNPYVMAKLIQTDLVNNDSSESYEATYKYTLNGHTKIYTSATRYTNPKNFDKEIKLYYIDKSTKVYEKPSNRLIVIFVIATLLCLGATTIYLFF